MNIFHKIAVISLAIPASLAVFPPSEAQALEFQINDTLQIDLDRDRTEIQPRLSTDGEQLNLELYEQPQPETQVEINENSVEIEQEQDPAVERLDLSIPIEDRR
jgi:septum formation topological specificity factor MinE